MHTRNVTQREAIWVVDRDPPGRSPKGLCKRKRQATTWRINGRGERIRTSDLTDPNRARYPAAPHPVRPGPRIAHGGDPINRVLR